MLVSVLGGVAMARSRMVPNAASLHTAALVAKTVAVPTHPEPAAAPAPVHAHAPEVVTVTALPVEEPPVAKSAPILQESKPKRGPSVAPKNDSPKPMPAPRAVGKTRSRDGVDDGF
jgi:hypothetical protein